MGTGAGKLKVMKSNALSMIMVLSMLMLSSFPNVAKYIIMLMMATSQ